MLFMNYYRSGRDNASPPNPRQIPLDPNWGGIGFSHIYLKSFTSPVYQVIRCLAASVFDSGATFAFSIFLAAAGFFLGGALIFNFNLNQPLPER